MAEASNAKQRHCYDYKYEEELVMMWPEFKREVIDRIKETVLDDSDIVIATYAKCGTTWMQEIVYLIHTEGDFKGSDETPVYSRYFFLEMQLDDAPDIDKYNAAQPPRLVKTHLPAKFYSATLRESKAKFVVVYRNPKDMLVSYYHYYKACGFAFPQSGTWEEFFQRFKDKSLVFGDYFENFLTWWQYREDPRFLFLKYEDMLLDPTDAIKQVAKHLGKDLSPELLHQIVERTSFKFMKSHPMLNYSTFPGMKMDVSPFMRKGSKGDWKNFFTQEQTEFVDNLIKTKFEPVGITFQD